MKYFVDVSGNYIGGFQGHTPAQLAALLPLGAAEVPAPPEHALDIWTGAAWDKAARMVVVESEQAKRDLIAIDLASIRSIREYIAAKADAPQILKDKEAAAQAARVKVK